jgi:hypothetical protein
MKRILSPVRNIMIVTILLLLLIPAAAALADSTGVSVSAPAGVEPDEQFTVNITVVPGTEIAGVQFNLAFDPAVVSIDSVVEGDLLSQDGAATYFDTGTIDNIAGTLTGVAGAITTPGATVASSGIFAIITMTASSSGGTSPLTLSDIVIGDVDGQPVDIIVTSGQVAVNRAPVLDAIGAWSTDEGTLLDFTISAIDPDGNPLNYSATGLPDGASFNTTTHSFTWTPRYDQAGIYTVTFQVSDGTLTDFEDVTITIYQPYPNWDVNWDSAVNASDMILIAASWEQTGLTGWIKEDANEDGTINVLDMIIVGQHWTD